MEFKPGDLVSIPGFQRFPFTRHGVVVRIAATGNPVVRLNGQVSATSWHPSRLRARAALAGKE